MVLLTGAVGDKDSHPYGLMGYSLEYTCLNTLCAMAENIGVCMQGGTPLMRSTNGIAYMISKTF